jgi:ribosomal protein S18 acetylase RimI-like enzyme
VNDITVNYFDHSVSFKPIKVVDLKAIAIKEKKFFDYGNDYSYAQLKALHDDVNTKIVGGYNRDNKIISYVIYTVSDKIDILKLFVDKTYRRRGIAGKMIDIVKETNRNIIVEVSAKNTTAIKFYLKNKFKQISIRKSYYGTHDALILEFENKKPAVS